MSNGIDIGKISPSLFMPTSEQTKNIDEYCQDYLRHFYPYFLGKEFNNYSLRRFESCTTISVPLMLASGLALNELTALEIGCGRGMKSFPMAPLFKQYIGVDLESAVIADAKQIASDLQINNIQFFCANAVEIVNNPFKFGIDYKIDVLFLNAVLEHLTTIERVEIFSLMRQVKESGGSVIFLESPNRLFSFDHHSSELHFVDNLPDDVALRYIREKTKRPYALDFVKPYETEGAYSDDPLLQLQKNILLNESDPIVRLYRLGRGVSYHDFELDYYSDNQHFNPMFDGYHPLLLGHQPLTRTELYLQDYFLNNNLPVHRLFSRSWIDFFDIGANNSGKKNIKYMSPTGKGRFEAVNRKEFWSLDLFSCSSEGELQFCLPEGETISQFTVMLEQVASDDCLVISCDGEVVMDMTLNELSQTRLPTWHKQYSLPIPLPENCKEVSVRSKGTEKVFLHGALVE
jgi:2-polyprenyl-3-methyl-5-hydroxy-6-metoxy-1,4-benzoquinol methylase